MITYRTGNDTYSWAAGVPVYETIWDAGGIDTLDASNQSTAVYLSLTQAEWSQIAPLTLVNGDGQMLGRAM